MRLQAALLPPDDARDDLAAVVASVPGGHEQWMPVPAHLLHLRLVNFGKVTLGDSEALRDTLRKEMTHWPPMTFVFRGGVAPGPPGDDSAWAKLEGDIAQLNDVTNLVVRVVKRLGFLVDRRLPRTVVRVGRTTPLTTPAFVKKLIGQLDSYQGPDWACHDLALLSVSDSALGAGLAFQVVDRLPLTADDPSADSAKGTPGGRHLK